MPHTITNPEIELYKQVRPQLDVYKVAGLLGISPLPKQKEMFDIVNGQNYETLVGCLGRRSGKSYGVGVIAITELLTPNASVLLISPTFANSKVIFQEVLKNVIKLGLTITQKDTKGMTITLENGAKFVSASPKNITSVLGHRYSLVIYDEANMINNLLEDYNLLVSPTQNDYGIDEETGYKIAKTIFISTPRTKKHDFYQLYRDGKDPDKKSIYTVHGTIYDNPMMPQAMIDRVKENVPEQVWKTEYLAEFLDISDDIAYYGFNYNTNVVAYADIRPKINKYSKFIVGIDIGYTDSTAYVLAWVEPLTGNVYVIEEYFKNKLPVPKHCENFINIEQKYGLVGDDVDIERYIDPSAVQASADMIYSYDYETIPAYRAIDEGIDLINTAFLSGKLFITDNCPRLVEQVENLELVNKKAKRSDKYGHFDLALASFRYMFASYAKATEMCSVDIIEF